MLGPFHDTTAQHLNRLSRQVVSTAGSHHLQTRTHRVPQTRSIHTNSPMSVGILALLHTKPLHSPPNPQSCHMSTCRYYKLADCLALQTSQHKSTAHSTTHPPRKHPVTPLRPRHIPNPGALKVWPSGQLHTLGLCCSSCPPASLLCYICVSLDADTTSPESL